MTDNSFILILLIAILPILTFVTVVYFCLSLIQYCLSKREINRTADVTLEQEIFTIQMNPTTTDRRFSYGPLRYSNNYEINPPPYDALMPPPKYETLKINLFEDSEKL
ncbi:unnamed protein product [Chironomus riparius]|uniref:Uncharacterized protein n=1 Tax=Chironomus riparius TaxID=315576 RepID=A0A9N9WV96_9DIPT|nr:unnamed protein product [Chironomus riparius]